LYIIEHFPEFPAMANAKTSMLTRIEPSLKKALRMAELLVPTPKPGVPGMPKKPA
jgi:hypothetical protein